jgi:hypothetical protein
MRSMLLDWLGRVMSCLGAVFLMADHAFELLSLLFRARTVPFLDVLVGEALG